MSTQETQHHLVIFSFKFARIPFILNIQNIQYYFIKYKYKTKFYIKPNEGVIFMHKRD